MTTDDELKRLFNAYDVPFGLDSEKMLERVAGFRLAVKGQTVKAVRRAVDDFLSGAVARKVSKRSSLPTSDEFGARVRECAEAETVDMALQGMEYAPPFGPLWGLKMYDRLKDAPDAVLPRPPAFVRKMIEEGGETGARYALHHQAVAGYAEVNAMMAGASFGRGSNVKVSLKIHLDRMEPVPVAGDVFKSWRSTHAERGWPWFPDVGAQRVVYLPKDGERGLTDLLDLLAHEGGGQKV